MYISNIRLIRYGCMSAVNREPNTADSTDIVFGSGMRWEHAINEGRQTLDVLMQQTYEPDNTPGELYWSKSGVSWLCRPSLVTIGAGKRAILHSYGAVRTDNDGQRFFEWDAFPADSLRRNGSAILGLIREVMPGDRGPLVRTGFIVNEPPLRSKPGIIERAARQIDDEPWQYNPEFSKRALIKRISGALQDRKPHFLGQTSQTRNRLKDRRELV